MPPARGARRGIFGWALLLTSPVLLLALALSARARSWACRVTLSLCLPILQSAARRLGLAGASGWDPNARTIEDPVRCTHFPPSDTTGKEAAMILGTPRAYGAFCQYKCPVALPDGVATLPRDHHPTLPRDPGLTTRSSSANHSRPRHGGQDLPVWLAGVSSLEAAEKRAGKELWEWWLDALHFRSDSAGGASSRCRRRRRRRE